MFERTNMRPACGAHIGSAVTCYVIHAAVKTSSFGLG